MRDQTAALCGLPCHSRRHCDLFKLDIDTSSKGEEEAKVKKGEKNTLINFCWRLPSYAVDQEDVNGEKLTVKKWWIFGADFFHGLRRFFTVYKGRKR